MLPAFEICAIIIGEYGVTLWISLWLLQQRRLGSPRRVRRGHRVSSPRMFLVLGLILAWGQVPWTLGLFIGFQAAGWADLFPVWLGRPSQRRNLCDGLVRSPRTA